MTKGTLNPIKELAPVEMKKKKITRDGGSQFTSCVSCGVVVMSLSFLNSIALVSFVF
jgi:hypothetical protein